MSIASPMGSPPQVRGKLRPSSSISPKRGITPAGAGKTSPVFCIATKPWDHPRRCGENAECDLLYIDDLGSPPQVRGKRLAGLCVRCGCGITPAGAGKTQ